MHQKSHGGFVKVCITGLQSFMLCRWQSCLEAIFEELLGVSRYLWRLDQRSSISDRMLIRRRSFTCAYFSIIIVSADIQTTLSLSWNAAAFCRYPIFNLVSLQSVIHKAGRVIFKRLSQIILFFWLKLFNLIYLVEALPSTQSWQPGSLRGPAIRSLPVFPFSLYSRLPRSGSLNCSHAINLSSLSSTEMSFLGNSTPRPPPQPCTKPLLWWPPPPPPFLVWLVPSFAVFPEDFLTVHI